MPHDPTTDRPIVRQAIRALQTFGDPLDRDRAAVLLPMWRHAHALEQHEAAAVLAHFPPAAPAAPVPCGVCGGLIEHVTTGPDAPWWRHLGSIAGPPHSAQPAGFPAEPECAVCGVTIAHDGQHWLHTTDHGGDPHSAQPAGGGELR